jgi:hypothetical protein
MATWQVGAWTASAWKSGAWLGMGILPASQHATYKQEPGATYRHGTDTTIRSKPDAAYKHKV